MFETMVVELEELLSRLTRINDKMTEYTHTLGTYAYWSVTTFYLHSPLGIIGLLLLDVTDM